MLTASHGIAGKVDYWVGGGCAIHWHADAGSISLVLVANVEGGKEGMTAYSRKAGSSQKDSAEAHDGKLEW